MASRLSGSSRLSWLAAVVVVLVALDDLKRQAAMVCNGKALMGGPRSGSAYSAPGWRPFWPWSRRRVIGRAWRGQGRCQLTAEPIGMLGVEIHFVRPSVKTKADDLVRRTASRVVFELHIDPVSLSFRACQAAQLKSRKTTGLRRTSCRRRERNRRRCFSTWSIP